ncbi:hypothetical protein MPTA5024_36135 [Microbispora sp. ATCC PTA-5024]|nr:hypothetical protein MPTA5024_36135 [Microbispora sp. ATCC PTA-5024]
MQPLPQSLLLLLNQLQSLLLKQSLLLNQQLLFQQSFRLVLSWKPMQTSLVAMAKDELSSRQLFQQLLFHQQLLLFQQSLLLFQQLLLLLLFQHGLLQLPVGIVLALAAEAPRVMAPPTMAVLRARPAKTFLNMGTAFL